MYIYAPYEDVTSIRNLILERLDPQDFIWVYLIVLQIPLILGHDFFILVISPYRQDEKGYSTKRLLIIIIQCKHRRVFHPINGSNVETSHNSASIDRQL